MEVWRWREETEKQRCVRRTERVERRNCFEEGEGDGLCQMLLLGYVK